MARLTAEARVQVFALAGHFVARNRVEAADRLWDAVAAVLKRLSMANQIGRTYPSVYTELASAGQRWVKVHRYWFGYLVVEGEAVIVNVIDESADIPRRANRPGTPRTIATAATTRGDGGPVAPAARLPGADDGGGA